jgi:transcriptional regulator
MYIPEIYKNNDPAEIREFLTQNAFGILVNQTDAKLWATHIPMLFGTNTQGKEILTGHISKENPQWKSFTDAAEVLAIFSGPHAYISSSWYDHENVPTWNYIAVHIYGTVKILQGEAVIQSLKELVDKYESGSENPVRVEELSQKTMRQANGIVAFEITITDIHAVKKMSQNRDQKNYENVISELEMTQNHEALEVAKIMKCPHNP